MTANRQAHRLILLLLLPGCSIITDFSPDRFLEQSEERCSDGVDNDGNGAIDCADTPCKSFDFCKETQARCEDGRDNDADGLVDCHDPDCCSQPKCSMEPSCGETTATACTDGTDNDNNGLTDCADFSCQVADCCERLVPIVAETFSTTGSGCTPSDCATEPTACCEQLPKACNQFDSQRWIAWGLPSPLVKDDAFDPNQPCSCPASGLLSVTETALSPSLELEFEVEVPQSDSSISVGFVENLTIPTDNSQACAGIQSAFPMLAGVTLVGPILQTEVGGVVHQVPSSDSSTGGPQRFRIAVDHDGSILFYRDGRQIEATRVRVKPPFIQVRIMVQGRSTTARMDNLLLARRVGCFDPRSWVAGASGAGPAFSPAASGFDAAGVSSPSLMLVGSTYLMYYTGQSTGTVGTGIGLTTSKDGQTWQRGKKISIHGESSSYLSDPMVAAEQDGYVMLYRAGGPSDQARIAVARSSDGESWTHVQTALTPGASGTWDAGDIWGPMMLPFRHRLYLWYVGSGADNIPAVGLAVADKEFNFVKSDKNPALRPTRSGINDRGVTDPWVMLAGEVLHMWYVGHTWGSTNSINYAVSEDGRNWVQFPNNPVIASGDPTVFGSTALGAPALLDHWGTLQMWYQGTDPGGLPSIGQVVNLSAAAW